MLMQQRTSLTSPDSSTSRDESGLQEEITFIQRNSLPDKKQKQTEGRHGFGRIGFLLAFLLLLGMIYWVFSSFAREQIQSPSAKDNLVTQSQSLKQQSLPAFTAANKINYQTEYTAKGKSGDEFPWILWVQTDDELETKDMVDAMTLKNHIHFGKQDNFEVRVINNLNAYDWLSEEIIAFIKETHQKSKVDLPVFELLRLAILYEHGGIFLRSNILLMEGLGWVEDLMRGAREAERKVLSCQLPGTKIIMYHEDWAEGRRYKDSFIAAKPKAQLFKILLNMTEKVASLGAWPFPDYPNTIEKLNQDAQIMSFPGLTQNLITAIHRKDSNVCENYGVQSFDANTGIFMDTVDSASTTIQLNEVTFREKRGRKYLLRINMADIVGDITYVIQSGDLSCGGGNSLLKNKIMMVEGNKWLTEPKKTTRDVHLCIVSLAPMSFQASEQQVWEQLNRLGKQTFSKWNLVNFVEGLPFVAQKVSSKAVLVNASIYEGLNLQRAATKYCDPSSVMLLLDHDETLSTDDDLETLANHFKPIGVFAAFFKLKTSETLRQASAAVHQKIQRLLNKPNRDVLSDIGNLMRAFTVEMYRFISFVDLRQSLNGRYFSREIPLLSMLETCEIFYPCDNGPVVYQVRRIERHMAVPRQKVFTNITITSTRFKVANLTRHQYYAKFRYIGLCDAILTYQRYKASVEYLPVFNDGREDEGGLLARKGLPELIPRKIHQVWVGGEIPKFKKFLMDRLRESHPDYEYFLWTENNFTRENFPESYGLIKTLLEFDKRSPWSKMAMIADIARYEIVYRQGGFYLDTNYMLFKNNTLDLFLTYSLMDVQGMALRQRVFRDNGVFGAMKNHPNLARIVSHRGLSSRNHYSPDVVTETGPNYFGKIQLGEEELDPTIFQQSFEEFWPNYLVDGISENVNKCETPNSTPDSQVLVRSAKYSYLKNCSDYYEHYAFGIDFGREGASYSYRRW